MRCEDCIGRTVKIIQLENPFWNRYIKIHNLSNKIGIIVNVSGAYVDCIVDGKYYCLRSSEIILLDKGNGIKCRKVK